MPRAKTNGIELEYETLGKPSDPPLLLIIGWGLQMIAWPDELCKALVDRGYYVIRFDNRDIGLSSKIESGGVPDIFDVISKTAQGERANVPYRVDDLATDTVGLLDALNITSAHIAGLSLGGMVAQTIAIAYPQRIRSLISIMSTTGRMDLPTPQGDVLSEILKMPRTRETFIAQCIKLDRLLSGEVFPSDEERSVEYATRAYDRGFNPRGLVRQFAAIMASGSRVEALHSVKTPTLVIHGNRDPLLSIEGGKDTAQAIPGAKFLEIDGLGHYLSKAAWPTIVEAIADFTRQVETRLGANRQPG